MQHVSHCLGNLHTTSGLLAQVAAWREEGKIDEVTLEEREAQKSRLRLTTRGGRELALLLPRGTALADGDVFAVAGEDLKVLVHIALQEVMVLTPLHNASATDALPWAVRLGHVLGNQHWPVAVVGGQILTPVTLDRGVMETVLKTHHLTHYFSIQYERRSWPK
jgi:urease accessory protein